MKKSIRRIERRTRGQDTDDLSNDAGVMDGSFAWARQGVDDTIYLDKAGSGLPDYATARIYQGNNYLGSNGINNIQQIQFGSILDETLTGGNKADRLYGMRGADTLTGGKGSDYLEGGQGNDTYVYTQGDGLDTILDTDGNGKIEIDTITLSGGEQFGDNRVFRGKDANGGSHLYTFVTGNRTTGGDLLVDGAMLIKGYKPNVGNGMGITLADAIATQTPQAPAMPTTTRDIAGDGNPMEFQVVLAAGTVVDPAWKWSVLRTEVATTGTDQNGNPVVLEVRYFYNQRDDLDNLILDPGQPDLARNDYLRDSAGNDHIQSGGGNDIIIANRGGDNLIEAGEGSNNITAGAGSDIVIGGSGNDIINAGDGNNYIVVGDGINTVASGTGNDIIQSGAGRDTLRAGDGDNYVEAGGERDWLYSGAGNDILTGGNEGDILSSGSGDDRLYADTQVDAATAVAQGNTNANINAQGDWLAGGSGGDTLVGSDAQDVLMGGGGSDLLIGGAGDDDISGDTDWVATRFEWTVTDQADGTRYFYPANSNAQPTDGAADVIYAGEGADHVWGDLGNDVILGEGGADKLQGGSGNDIVMGSTGADFIYGEGRPADVAGNDYLDGGVDKDVIFGGAGDDIIVGGTGDDTLYGEAGQDTYVYNRGDGNDTVYDIKGDNNVLHFGAGITPDMLSLGLGSLLIDGDDVIDGSSAADTLIGLGGNDRMRWRLIAANDDAIYAWRVAA